MKRYVNAVMDILLSDRQRAIIRMRFLNGLSVSEIAARELMTDRAVRKNLKAALDILTLQKNIFLKGELK